MSGPKERELLLERYRREKWRQAIRSELFDKQIALYDDPEQFRACHAGRRGGKSTPVPHSSALDALNAGDNEYVIIGAETLKKAKALHWGNFRKLVASHGLPFRPNSQAGSWSTPWGAQVLFVGMNDNDAVELLRGYKMRAIRLDETQYFSHRLPHLISSIIEPALGDTGGTCTLYGTPSVTTAGDWSDICMRRTHGWSVHHWDVRDNKEFPRDAMSFLQQVLLRNKWTWDPGDVNKTHPIFAREYLGLFVNDTSMQVYKYVSGRNDADALPVPVSQGFCTMGIDYGAVDNACAWTVVWSARGSREIYVVECQKHHNMQPDDAAVITKQLYDRWQPQTIVGDGGGLGASYVVAFNRRYGELSDVWVHNADKQGMLGQIAIVNGELASGRIKLLPAAADLKAEIQILPWKDGKRTKEDDGYESDCADSARYCIVAHIADMPKPPKPPPSEEQLRAAEIEERRRRAREKQNPRGLLRSG